MIELRTLGEIDLRIDGIAADAVLSQPKQFALFTYLVVDDVTAHQRERLMAMFWPELSTERARGALRKAVHYLRRAVGDDVFLNRGDDAIVVDRSGIRCDATALQLAVDNGEGEIALRLYRGEFLTGFHVDRAPDFDQWLESRRKHFSDGAVRCGIRFARELEQCGSADEAVYIMQDVLQLTPYSPHTTHAVVELMMRAGYNVKAVHIYESLARRLESELGDTEQAIVAYQHVDQLWHELECQITQRRTELRDRLRQLRGRTTRLVG